MRISMSSCEHSSTSSCQRAVPRWRAWEAWQPLFVLPFLLVASLLGGCVVGPVEAQEPIVLPATTVGTAAIAPIEGPPGTTIYVSGAGWQPGEVVYINLQQAPDGETIEATVTTATADGDGRFNTSFAYPIDLMWSEPGPIEVVAYSLASGEKSSTLFTVTAAVATATPIATATAMAGTTTVVPTVAPTVAVDNVAVDNVAVVVSRALNVRMGPSTLFPIITAVQRGTRLRVLGQNASGAWLLVRLPDGREGWVARAYTDYTRAAPVVPAPQPPVATATPTPPFVSGWRGEYFANPNLSGRPTVVRDDSSIDFDWGYGAPAPQLPADYFSVRWVRNMFLAGGTYRFLVRSDDGVRVWVDGDLVINEWHAASGQTYNAVRRLSSGSHIVRVEYYEATQLASVRFWWEVTGDFAEWRGEYYTNQNLSGQPRVVRNDSAINFDWGSGAPAPEIPANNFSVRWTRDLHLDAATYRFHVRTDDGMRVFLDNSLILDEWRTGSVRENSRDLYVGSGVHTLRVEYFDEADRAVANFWWERISEPEPDDFPDWKGEYWTNRDLDGSPRVVRNDDEIDFNWGDDSPDSRIPDDNFSARWTQTIDFDEGRYRFYARSDDGVRVYVDDDRIINEWRDMRGQETFTADIDLDGDERVKVEYYEHTGGAAVEVWWDEISGTATPTPTSTPEGEVHPYADAVPNRGPSGTRVTVSGGGFPASTVVNLHLGGVVRASSLEAGEATVYASTTTDSHGNYSMQFIMPDTWPDGTQIDPGQLVILVATAGFGVEASAVFEYEAPQPTPVTEPYIDLVPASGGPGTGVTVNGGGFPKNTTVNIHLAGLVQASSAASETPHVYASVSSNGQGRFSVGFTMPDNWPDGTQIETGKLMVVAATSGFGTQASEEFDYFRQGANPSIELSPTAGNPGTRVTVSGDGFPANTLLNLYLATLDTQEGGSGRDYVYATTYADRNGRYSMAFKVPSEWPGGEPIVSQPLVVLVANGDFSIEVSATFQLTGGSTQGGTPTATPTATQPAINPNVILNPDSGGAGTNVRVTGNGFPGGVTVYVYLGRFDGGGSPAGDAERYATATTNGQGDFTTAFTMPGSWPDGTAIRAGSVLVIAATQDFGVQTSAVFTFQGAAGARISATVTATATTPAVVEEATLAPTATPRPRPTRTPQPATETPVDEDATPTKAPADEPSATKEVEPTAEAPTAMPTDTPELSEPSEGEGGGEPTPTLEPLPTDTPTPEPLPTDTPTPEPVLPTDTPMPEPPLPTDTPMPEPLPTDTPTPEPVLPTDTPMPEPPLPTDTPTPEPVLPTDTPMPEAPLPADTPTPEPVLPTDTPAPELPPPTNTPMPEPVLPTDTPTPTYTPTLEPPPAEQPAPSETPTPEEEGGAAPPGEGGS